MQERTTDSAALALPRVTHDVVISAVRYDGLLVADLSGRLAVALGATPFWRGMQIEGSDGDAALVDSTRLAVIVHQRLWAHDSGTQADALELQQIGSRSRLPVCVIQVDDEPIPAWLTESPNLAVHVTSVEDIVEQVRKVFPEVMLHGTSEIRTHMIADADPTHPAHPTQPARWGNAPPPYLDQPRSASALRHALDDLEAELDRRVTTEQGHATKQGAKLHRAPGRLVVQLAEVGISFSWVPARSGSVSDGRLLVIEWEGVVAHGRGMGAMRTASPGRERVFQPEATGPSDLRWRSSEAGGATYSSFDLAAQAFAGALLTRGGLASAEQVEHAAGDD